MRFIKEGLREGEDPPWFFLGGVMQECMALITKSSFPSFCDCVACGWFYAFMGFPPAPSNRPFVPIAPFAFLCAFCESLRSRASVGDWLPKAQDVSGGEKSSAAGC